MLTLKVLIGVIEEEDKNDPVVVSVNDACTSVNHELGSCVARWDNFYIGVKQGKAGGVPRPLQGATRPYVPGGTAIEIWVSMQALPFAGMTFFSALFSEWQIRKSC